MSVYWGVMEELRWPQIDIVVTGTGIPECRAPCISPDPAGTYPARLKRKMFGLSPSGQGSLRAALTAVASL